MKVIVTKKDSDLKLSEIKDGIKTNKEPSIILDENTKYQKWIGFGGAFTESACYNLYRINPKLREEALKCYFGEEGIGYTMGRVSIHSCDFSLNSYQYIKENDEKLETFDISRDRWFTIPVIKEAQKILGSKISFLASPWTPVPFMKDNNSPIRGGHLLRKYYDLWARYMVRFIDEYQKEGINIDYMSVQNEPQAIQRWDSCIYSKEEERDFVKVLGPKLKEKHPNVKLCIWDHNRDIMVERAKAVYDDKEASQYVWGTAFHWYVSEDFMNVEKVHNLNPSKHLMFSEGCVEGQLFGKWESGERYARNILEDMNHFNEVYLDWNLFLDETGGPNHVNNLCDAPIIVHVNHERLIKESSYYCIGQFSKFIKPEAYRIGVNNKTGLRVTSFKNVDNSIVVVVLNEKENDEKIVIKLKNESLEFNSLSHSVMTIVF